MNRVLLIAAGCVWPTLACVSPGTLYFATYTKVGVSAEAVQTNPTSLELGYNRFEGALVPVTGEDGTIAKEAPSIFACMHVDNRWFGGLSLVQTFATGKSASSAAKKASGDCLKDVEKAAERAGQ